MIASADAADNGRRSDGTFAAGNTFGRGNPIHKRVREMRMQMLEYATPERQQRVIKKLYRQACAGDMDAIREWLNRTLGKPKDAVEWEGDEEDGTAVVLTREVLEAALASRFKVVEPKAN